MKYLHIISQKEPTWQPDLQMTPCINLWTSQSVVVCRFSGGGSKDTSVWACWHLVSLILIKSQSWKFFIANLLKTHLLLDLAAMLCMLAPATLSICRQKHAEEEKKNPPFFLCVVHVESYLCNIYIYIPSKSHLLVKNTAWTYWWAQRDMHS